MGDLKPQIMWFIGGRYFPSGERFLYANSGSRTRRDAIRDHEKAIGRPWAQLKREGDFAVKCKVEPTP